MVQHWMIFVRTGRKNSEDEARSGRPQFDLDGVPIIELFSDRRDILRDFSS
jgi:hypothetical protein